MKFSPTYVLTTAGLRFCGGHQSKFEITCFDTAGRALTRTALSALPSAIPAEAREYFRTSTLAANVSLPPDAQAKLKEMLRLTEFATSAPAFGIVRSATSGDLWVAPFDYKKSMINRDRVPTSDLPQRWIVMGSNGRWLSNVDLPPRFSLLDAGRDYVAGIARDSEDIESAVVYRLTRK